MYLSKYIKQMCIISKNLSKSVQNACKTLTNKLGVHAKIYIQVFRWEKWFKSTDMQDTV